MSNESVAFWAVLIMVWGVTVVAAAVVSFDAGRKSAAEAFRAYRDHVANLNEIMDRYHRMLFTGGADCGDE